MAVYHSTTPEPVPITTLTDLHDLVTYYLAQPYVVFDVETIGDNRGNPRKGPVVWLALSTTSRTDIIPMGHPHGELVSTKPVLLKSGRDKLAKGKTMEDLRPTDFSKNKVVHEWSDAPIQLRRADVFSALEPVFFHPAIVKVGHNIKFDLHAVGKYYDGDLPEPPYFDTHVASWLQDVTLSKRGGLGLGDIVKRRYGFEMDKDVGKNVALHPYSTVARYAYYDAHWTKILYLDLLREYRKASPEMRDLLDLEMQTLVPVVAMEDHGVRIDIERLEELEADVRDRALVAEQKVYDALGRKFEITKMDARREVLFGSKADGGLGLTPRKLTDSGEKKAKAGDPLSIYDYSVGNDHLQEDAGNPVVAALLDFNALNKLHGTYLASYLGKPNIFGVLDKKKEGGVIEDGRIHARFIQTGAESGRFSSAGPNLQNIPSRTEDGKRFREIFIADEGHKLVVADYAQIEPRITASVCGEHSLRRTFIEGEDFYQNIADRVGITRSQSKILNLAIAYGAGADKLHTQLGISVKEAKEILEYLDTSFPNINRTKALVIAKARKDRYSETLMKRRRPLPAIAWRSDREKQAEAERQAFNHVIQGTAADIMKKALVEVYYALPEHAHLVLTVHDEVVVSVTESQAEETAKIVKSVMERQGDGLIDVPLIAEVNIVDRWSEAK